MIYRASGASGALGCGLALLCLGLFLLAPLGLLLIKGVAWLLIALGLLLAAAGVWIWLTRRGNGGPGRYG